MSTITPQDLSSSISVLDFLLNYADEHNNIEMREEVEEIINQYNEVITEHKDYEKLNIPYNKKDAYSILEYLKLQAEQLSNGSWTDFSDSDIGTVFLKLMSYLADMNNFQTDKTVSELYLDTCTERASIISLCKLIGYEPRHYQSAEVNMTLGNTVGSDIPNGTLIPKFSAFTDPANTIKYTLLQDEYIYDNTAKIKLYEGVHCNFEYTISDIDEYGRIILQDYTIGTNTISLKIDSMVYEQVDDVRFSTGNLAFSVHISEDRYLYIQLPSYWTDLVSQGSVIQIDYLTTNGERGRVGKNIITKIEQLNSPERSRIEVKYCSASEGGYDPESVDELRVAIPKRARTMDTIVTINDFEEVGTSVLGISDISALDYNDPSSGLVQPDDYYKVHIYALPDAETYDAEDSELIKYRNTIIKEREDWNIEDMSNVAEGVDRFSVNSVQGNIIRLENYATVYSYQTDIVPSVDTGIESTSYLIDVVQDPSVITDRIVCKIEEDNNDILITLNNNWRDFVSNTDKIDIYYKREQVLTERGQRLRDYIDSRRLTSLNVTYHDLTIVHPDILIDVYMDKNDIRYENTGTRVKEFILDKYSRKNLKIGEPIFASVIGADILTEFNYIRYVEVVTPEEKIEVLPRGFIDVVPNISDGGTLVDKVIIRMHDYKNRVI